MTTGAAVSGNGGEPFVHEALFYRDAADYLAGTVPFVLAGLHAGAPVLVAVPGPNLELLRHALGPAAGQVRFLDMTQAGRNPGRIIPTVLADFLDDHPGVRSRVIGEPIWPGRSVTEYPACVQHEALINLAFAGRTATILCPYDAGRLTDEVLADACGTHPILVSADRRERSERYLAPEEIVATFNTPLPEPEVPAEVLVFGFGDLPVVRKVVGEYAAHAGLPAHRVGELRLAVHEAAANTVEHAGGPGTLRVWRDGDTLVAEVRDRGHIRDPMAGRRRPARDHDRGRGLLLINCLCDLVRIHTEETSTTVRLYVRV
jgi:anti-sigma regulatory factor (Ser/Thr protein kinase)